MRSGPLPFIPTPLRRRTWSVAAFLFVALLAAAGRADYGADFFEKKVRPVFVEH